jgi:ABC-type transport system involved in multi-copper enzyme maturation permease subunit
LVELAAFYMKDSLMQVWALLVDSYRLLLNRKLFWITLVVSSIVVLIYASIGFDETGWSMFFGLTHFDSDIFKAGTDAAKSLYLGIFSTFIVGYWFTWAATILALVSTAPIMNDFMADGSIDLVLSKPLNRVTVFFVKYMGGLLFVLLQMTLFTVGVYLCVGWRVGVWNSSILMAIPLVLLFFSYLYCVSVLLTMLTRSTIASLMLTLLFWVVIFGVNQAEITFNRLRIQSEVFAQSDEIRGRRNSRSSGAEKTQKTVRGTKSEREAMQQAKLQQQKQEKQAVEKQKKSMLKDAEGYEVWQKRLETVLAVLPKTKQTTDLVEHWTSEEGEGFEGTIMSNQNRGQDRGNNPMQEIQKRLDKHYRDVSPWYIIGSSLAFEMVVLGFACFLFVRRDF